MLTSATNHHKQNGELEKMDLQRWKITIIIRGNPYRAINFFANMTNDCTLELEAL